MYFRAERICRFINKSIGRKLSNDSFDLLVILVIYEAKDDNNYLFLASQMCVFVFNWKWNIFGFWSVCQKKKTF